ncbi:MAG: hypothetical protein HYU97_00690 [Deltaproteobacteria bacterium]|nr:hypothetical protein [Deltaproteobacteria bacterium]
MGLGKIAGEVGKVAVEVLTGGLPTVAKAVYRQVKDYKVDTKTPPIAHYEHLARQSIRSLSQRSIVINPEKWAKLEESLGEREYFLSRRSAASLVSFEHMKSRDPAFQWDLSELLVGLTAAVVAAQVDRMTPVPLCGNEVSQADCITRFIQQIGETIKIEKAAARARGENPTPHKIKQ